MSGCTRRLFLQVRQSVQIAPEQVVGKSQRRGSARLIEWIKPLVRFKRLDGPSRVTSKQQGERKVIVGGIWIELGRALELDDGRFVLAHETQCPAERHASVTQARGQSHSLAS